MHFDKGNTERNIERIKATVQIVMRDRKSEKKLNLEFLTKVVHFWVQFTFWLWEKQAENIYLMPTTFYNIISYLM